MRISRALQGQLAGADQHRPAFLRVARERTLDQYPPSVIVVIGSIALERAEQSRAAGLAAAIATGAVQRGAAVEVVGRVGDDEAGDAALLALAQAGVGHVAVLRDPRLTTPVVETTPVLEETTSAADDPAVEELPAASGAAVASSPITAADLELGLRYLTDFGVVAIADPLPADALAVVVDAVAFASARLVVLVPPGSPVPDVPADTTVLEAPSGTDERFAAFVAAYATALDRGEPPASAFDRAVRETGTEPAPGD